MDSDFLRKVEHFELIELVMKLITTSADSLLFIIALPMEEILSQQQYFAAHAEKNRPIACHVTAVHVRVFSYSLEDSEQF